MSTTGDPGPTAESTRQANGPAVPPERELARRRVQSKRDFTTNVVAYLVINSFMIGVWAVTGGGYFWPAWILAGWGVGLVLHGWDTFFRRPATEADVDAELHRKLRR